MRPDLARIGYAKGVPMGGDLTQAPQEKAPSFLIRAAKDPDGANLDRVQVIKGWRDADGELHGKVHNVAMSNGRQENADGDIEPVGNTLDVKDASYTNSIGDPEFAVVWTDPGDRESHRAIVLEIDAVDGMRSPRLRCRRNTPECPSHSCRRSRLLR